MSGNPYNRDTHETIEEEESESDSGLDTDGRIERDDRKRTQFYMGEYYSCTSPGHTELRYSGNHCCRRARAYHSLSHWEDDVYDRISEIYYDLLRAAKKKVPDESDTSSEDDPDEDQLDRVGRRLDRKDRRERSERRAAELRYRRMPKDVEDVDDVLMWMDENKVQSKVS